MTDAQPLPPPPPNPAPPTTPYRDARVGELTPQWRLVMVVTWAMVFLSYMAMWKASEELGIGTWWLGPRSNPQPTVVSLIPFVIIVLVGGAASFNIRYLPWIGIAGSLALTLIAIPDLSRSVGLAVVEFAIAGAAMIVSLTSLTGVYRRPPGTAAEPGR